MFLSTMKHKLCLFFVALSMLEVNADLPVMKSRSLGDNGTTRCSCTGCDDSVWNTMASGHTCGNRITWLQMTHGISENEACLKVAASESPIDCGACNPNTCPPPPPPPARCGCNDCTDAVWNADADGPTCGGRITWLQMGQGGLPEDEACRQVAGMEFPIKCLGCDPETCGGGGNNPTPVPHQNSKCGGAVDSSSSSVTMCQNLLWEPTGDTSMHCFSYGGLGDSCHLNNNNDPNDGLDKDPSNCYGDTFYLWDEPDIQGKSYAWAGTAWAEYATNYGDELTFMRQEAGTKVTTPLVKAGGPDRIMEHVDTFFSNCGAACRDPSSPAYVDIVAVNAFCGPWNGPPDYCRGGAAFILREVEKVFEEYNLPVYITNWSRLQTSSPEDQADAIDAVDAFFAGNSPIERVYWFGATDYGGGSGNNLLTSELQDGTTLGEMWKEKCDTLN